MLKRPGSVKISCDEISSVPVSFYNFCMKQEKTFPLSNPPGESEEKFKKLFEQAGVGVAQISDTKKAEQDLIESEAKFKSIFYESPIGIELYDKGGKLVDCNPACLQIFGVDSVNEVKGFSLFEDPNLSSQQKRDIKEGKNVRFEIEFDFEIVKKLKLYNTSKSGRCYLNCLTTAFKTSENTKLGFLIHVMDITENKKAEHTIKEENDRFQTAMNAIDSIVYVSEMENHDILFINKYVKNLFGEIVGQKCYSALQGRSEPCEFCTNHLLIDKKGNSTQPHIWEFQNLITKKWYQCHDQAIRWTNGKLVRFEIATDITKEKVNEVALTDSMEKLELALVSGNIGVWDWNPATDELFWDKRTHEIFGIDESPSVRIHKDFENLIHVEDRSHVQKAIEKILEDATPLDTIFRIKSSENVIKYINSKARVYKDAQGKTSRVLGVYIDVTEMKNSTEKVLFKLNEELLRSNKELQSFAYVASHDLKEPLRMISSFTQLLSRQYKHKLDQNAQDYIQFAVDGAKRMYDLIDALLAYSRLNTRGSNFAMVNMQHILELAYSNLRIEIAKKNGEVTWDGLLSVFADKDQMMQLMQNLLSNAIKFSNEKPRIHISCKEENNKIVFSVKDNGIGIDSQYFEKIFQIFQSLHTKDKYEGTGIGLAICKRIIELHGGKIWVLSQLGKGSAFYFSIPKKENQEQFFG